MRSRLDRVASALAGVETSPRVFVTEWLEPPYSAGHWVPDMVSAARGDRRRRNVRRAVAPDALARRGRARAGRRRPRAVRLRSRPDALRGRPARPLGAPARHAGTPGEPRLRGRRERHVLPARARGSSTASSCSRTSSIPASTRIRARPGAGSASRGSGLRGRMRSSSADELDRVAAGGLVADEARAGGEVEAPAVVGALEHVAEHLALDERVSLVRAGVVEGVQLAVDREDDDLTVAGVDRRRGRRRGRRPRR